MNNYLNTACIHTRYISHANLLCRWLVGRFTAKTEKARADEVEWKHRGQQRPLRKSSGREGARGSCPHAKEAKVRRLLLFSFLVLEFSFQRKFKFLFLASLKIAMKIYFQYVLKFFFLQPPMCRHDSVDKGRHTPLILEGEKLEAGGTHHAFY